jgi:glutathione synthase
MDFLVVMDPIERAVVDKDTTFGFMLKAQNRGHRLFFCDQADLYSVGADGYARCAPVTVQAVQGEHFELGPWADQPLSAFHSVWMRKDPPVDRAYLHATHLLDLAGPRTLVVNSPSGVRFANEKLYALHFAEFTPQTMVTRDAARIRRWLDERGEPLVVKPVDGHGGLGVFVLEPGDRNVGSILETLGHEGRRWMMAQEYLAAAREGDKRIIMINGEPLGGILRVPQADDHRGNIHVGGTVEATALTERELAMCAAMGPRLRADGLWFVGLDVIGGYLTEVNVTSPTGIRELEALGGVDAGDRYVEWVERQVEALRA